jgi:hypothetical protein
MLAKERRRSVLKSIFFECSRIWPLLLSDAGKKGGKRSREVLCRLHEASL